MKRLFKRRIMAVALTAAMLFQTMGTIPVFAVGNSGGTDYVCENHREHDEDCGYVEAVAGSPCTHQHTEECYTEVENCVHEHTPDCYEDWDEEVATGSNAAEPTECDHFCDEESGCITKKLDCHHVHDEDCGYVAAVAASPCTHSCELCEDVEDGELATDSNAQQISDAVKAVQKLIDDLPTVTEVKAMDTAEQNSIYMELQTANDAYTALSAEEQEQITDAEKLDDLFAWYNSLVMPAVGETTITLSGSQSITITNTGYTITGDAEGESGTASNTYEATGPYILTGTTTGTLTCNADCNLTFDNLTLGNDGNEEKAVFTSIRYTVAVTVKGENSLTGGINAQNGNLSFSGKRAATDSLSVSGGAPHELIIGAYYQPIYAPGTTLAFTDVTVQLNNISADDPHIECKELTTDNVVFHATGTYSNSLITVYDNAIAMTNTVLYSGACGKIGSDNTAGSTYLAFTGNNTSGTVVGNMTAPVALTLNKGQTLVISGGASLTADKLTQNGGTIFVAGKLNVTNYTKGTYAKLYLTEGGSITGSAKDQVDTLPTKEITLSANQDIKIEKDGYTITDNGTAGEKQTHFGDYVLTTGGQTVEDTTIHIVDCPALSLTLKDYQVSTTKGYIGSDVGTYSGTLLGISNSTVNLILDSQNRMTYTGSGPYTDFGGQMAKLSIGGSGSLYLNRVGVYLLYSSFTMVGGTVYSTINSESQPNIDVGSCNITGGTIVANAISNASKIVNGNVLVCLKNEAQGFTNTKGIVYFGTIPAFDTNGNFTYTGGVGTVYGNPNVDTSALPQGGILGTDFDENVTVTIPDVGYTGETVVPVPVVTVNKTALNKTLVAGTDYTFEITMNDKVSVGQKSVTITAKDGSGNTGTKTATFNVVKSGTTFDGGLTVDKADKTYTYGETMTVTATPKATGTAAVSRGRALMTLAAPTTNQMALFVDDTQISDAVNGENGVYTMTYDTANKDLAIGANTITAKYVGNDNMADYSDSVTITLNKKAITTAAVSNATGAVYSKVYDGTTAFTGVTLTPGSAVLSGDTVTATANGNADNENVGENKTFTATGTTLGGAQADYYSLANDAVSGAVAITTATPNVTVTAEKKTSLLRSIIGSHEDTIILTATVNGVTDGTVPTGTVTFKNGETVIASNVTMTNGVATYEWVNPAANSYTITAEFTAAASTNYGNATGTSSAFDIDKADQRDLSITGVPSTVAYADNNFTLSTTGGSGTGTTVTYAVTAGSDVVSVNASTGEVTVLKVGTATITATKAGDTNYNEKTGTVEITVQGAAPVLTWDSETQATTYTGSPVLESALTKPTVTLKNSETYSGTIQYAYKYVGGLTRGLFEGYTDGLPTNAGRYEIKAHIDAQGNYAAADSTNVMTLTVEKSTPTLAINTMNGKDYDGTAITAPAAGDMTITGAKYADVTFTYSKNADMTNPLATAPKNAGTYYVQASVADGNNTNAATSTAVSFTIAKANITGISQDYLVVKELAKDYDITLKNLLPSIDAAQEYGTITYAVASSSNADGVLTSEPTNSNIADGKLKVSVAKAAEKDKTATVTISMTTDNFTVSSATITVKTVDKKPLTISNVAMPNREYNGTAYSYSGTPTFTDTTNSSTVTGVTVTKEYEGRLTTSYTKNTTAPVNAGTYNLILTVSGTSAETYVGSLTVPFEITKKEVTVTAKDRDILVGGTVPSLANPALGTDYTTDGFVGSDTLGGTVSMSYTGTVDNTAYGSYPITISGGTVSDNYTVKYVNGTLSITMDVTLINTAITAAGAAKTGITVSDSAASSVASGTKFVTTAEMTALNTAIQTATSAKTNVTTLAQVQAAATALDEAVKTFNAAIKTGTYTASSGGGGSSSGGSSSSDDSSDNSTTVTTPPATTENPKPATEVTTTVTPSVSGTTATVNVTTATVNSAIQKAQDEAKKNGTTENGIVVEIKVDTKNTAISTLTANLPKTSVDALVQAAATEVRITSGVADLSLNLNTLKEIQKQLGTDANVTVKKVDSSTLNPSVQKLVGNRPVYDFSITGTNGKKLTNFGSGKISISIPYTLRANETAANLIAYYINDAGKAVEMPNSVYDPIAKTLNFVTDHFSTFAVGYKNTSIAFTDTINHWAKDSIEFVAARGILAGTGNNQFSPDTAMTRGMFVTALGRLAEADVSSYTKSSFTDVKADAYYMGYVEWAAKNGIVNGTTTTTFAPDQSITREQMAVIMANYAKAIGFTLPKVHAENVFADNGSISSYAKDAVKAMQMAGILSGKTNNRFDPQGTATRAEVSAVLKRFVELVISTDSAEGWTVNDSGKWMYYENGKAVTGQKTIGGISYTFNSYGEAEKAPTFTLDTYVVKKGESWWSIAWDNKVNMFALARLNDKSIFSMLYVGDELKIPEN